MEKLAKANELLAQIAKRHPHVTPVSLDDFELFQSFFAKEKQHTYGNTWTYVTQGVYGVGPHKLGYKYYDGKNLSMLATYPKLLEPDVIMFYWLRPMGETVVEKIAEVSKDVKEHDELSTYVKKIFPKQAEALKTFGFQDTTIYPWHPIAHSEDETYPELIIDIKHTLDLINNAPRRKNVRLSYIKAKRLEKRHKVEIKTENVQEDAWKVVLRFFKERHSQSNEILSNEYDYYNMLFNNIARPTVNTGVIYIDSEPMAFYLTEIDNHNYTNFYAAITLRKIHHNF